MIKEYTYRETYITFLLIGDNFEISKLLREKCRDWGMNEMFEDCLYIARRFVEYDERNLETMSMYDSFERFIAEYDAEIRAFIEDNNKDFDIKGEE